MKTRYILIACLVMLLQAGMSLEAAAYSLMLPDSPPAPALPYIAEKDHYSGPASVQMILNSCPDIASRHYNSQDDIYNVILLRNTEPTAWFSDPRGVLGALYTDHSLSPCGSWSDASNPDKSIVLGHLLYYMDTMRYLMPVSIGSSEHWVTVIGYQTDVKPTYSGPVTLQNIFFYDPLPGNYAAQWVSGAVWTSSADYWGVPVNKPGSVWHNKYLALVEPPKVTPVVKVKGCLRQGVILPVRNIEQSFAVWLREIRDKKIIPRPFEELYREAAIELPVLVKAADYSYYLVRLKNRKIAAIFNAYDGSFEELRVSQQPDRAVSDPQRIETVLAENMRVRGIEVVETSPPVRRYDPDVAVNGRFSPGWEAQVSVRDRTGNVRQLPIFLDGEGRILKGL